VTVTAPEADLLAAIDALDELHRIVYEARHASEPAPLEQMQVTIGTALEALHRLRQAGGGGGRP
jgi:hypothetical protein